MQFFQIGSVFDRIKKQINILWRSLALFWVAAPWETTFLIFSNFLQGITPEIGVWITKQVVDLVTQTLARGQTINATSAATLVIAWISALLIETILPLKSYSHSHQNQFWNQV